MSFKINCLKQNGVMTIDTSTTTIRSKFTLCRATPPPEDNESDANMQY